MRARVLHGNRLFTVRDAAINPRLDSTMNAIVSFSSESDQPAQLYAMYSHACALQFASSRLEKF